MLTFAHSVHVRHTLYKCTHIVTHTHSHTHTHWHTHTHTHTQSHTHTLTHTLTHSHTHTLLVLIHSLFFTSLTHTYSSVGGVPVQKQCLQLQSWEYIRFEDCHHFEWLIEVWVDHHKLIEIKTLWFNKLCNKLREGGRERSKTMYMCIYFEYNYNMKCLYCERRKCISKLTHKVSKQHTKSPSNTQSLQASVYIAICINNSFSYLQANLANKQINSNTNKL